MILYIIVIVGLITIPLFVIYSIIKEILERQRRLDYQMQSNTS
jgi:hypothetical protein